jgi:hypothetical protein
MHLLRIVILALVCCLSLAGRSTSSPSVKTAYFEERGASKPALTTGLATSRGTVEQRGWRSGQVSFASLEFGGRSEAQHRSSAHELRLPPPSEVPTYEPAPEGEEPPPAPLDTTPRFRGQRDDELLARICNQPIKAIKPLGGGASIKFKVTFADGAIAALKPNQTRITRYQAEVAAYRLSRALGLGTVPPSCIRQVPRDLLMNGMPKDLRERMEAELLPDDKGNVACAVITWVPGLRGLKLETATWWKPALIQKAPIPPGKKRRLLEISSLLLFDYLILNYDRWSGANTHEVDGEMVFIDQGAGFGPDRRHRSSRQALHTLKWSQRFSRDVVQALFDVNLTELQHDLSDVLAPIDQAGLLYRIQHAKDYLRSLHRAAPHDSWL